MVCNFRFELRPGSFDFSLDKLFWNPILFSKKTIPLLKCLVPPLYVLLFYTLYTILIIWRCNMTFMCTTVHIYCTAPFNLLLIYFTWRCSFFYSDCNVCTACSNIFTEWCFINSGCAVGLFPSLSNSPRHAATKKL